MAPEPIQRIGAGVAVVFFVALYFGKRDGQIEVFSDAGEQIAIPTKGLSYDQVKQFLEAIADQYRIVNSRGSTTSDFREKNV